MHPWLLREEGHEPILPPLRYVVVLPHDGEEVVNQFSRVRPPEFNLCCGQTGWSRAFTWGEMSATMFELLEGEGGIHGVRQFLPDLLGDGPSPYGLHNSRPDVLWDGICFYCVCAPK
jgi:hypothetical protein